LVGLGLFAFLVWRAYSASFAALRMLRVSRGARNADRGSRNADRRPTPQPAIRNPPHELTEQNRQILDINARGMIAAIVGWTVCSMFASVAFNWTFYYVLALAVAGREIVASRRVETEPAAEARTGPAARL